MERTAGKLPRDPKAVSRRSGRPSELIREREVGEEYPDDAPVLRSEGGQAAPGSAERDGLRPGARAWHRHALCDSRPAFQSADRDAGSEASRHAREGTRWTSSGWVGRRWRRSG